MLPNDAAYGLTPVEILLALPAYLRPKGARFIAATLNEMAKRGATIRGNKVRSDTSMQFTRVWSRGPNPPNRGRVWPECPTCGQAVTGQHRHPTKEKAAK